MIEKLPRDVINKIAAGEVINKPCNALKELIENSLDARAQSVTVTYSDHQFSIQDNGSGINKDDYELLCERFATSKLQSYSQLLSGQVQTFGFRGEALASLSYVATLVVTSRVGGCHTYTGTFENGKLIAAKRSADTFEHGTVLVVKDLFKNTPIRYKTLDKQEYQRMVDVVWKYSIHYPEAQFTIKRNGVMERLPVPGDLTTFTREGHGVTIQGKVKVMDKATLVLFINNRLVESSKIKQAVGKCWCYLSLKIDPARVDVNVHPAKKQVQFLNETEICQFIGDVVSFELAQVREMPQPRQSEVPVTSGNHVPQKRRVSDVVRTDSRQRTLDSFHQPRLSSAIAPVVRTSVPTMTKSVESSQPVQSPLLVPHKSPALQSVKSPAIVVVPQPSIKEDNQPKNVKINVSKKVVQQSSSPVQLTSPKIHIQSPLLKKSKSISGKENQAEFQVQKAERVIVQLESVQALKSEIGEMSKVLANHTFIGMVNSNKALVQYDTGMYMVDIQKASQDFFYQTALNNFQNFGTLAVSLDCKELIQIALEVADVMKAPTELLSTVFEMSDMLMDYFNITIVDGKLTTLPLLLKDNIPELFKLPLFMLRLCTQVDFSDEQQCFHDVCHELSLLYSPTSHTSAHIIEHFLFYNFKTQKVATDACQLVVTLPDLYKVFERC